MLRRAIGVAILGMALVHASEPAFADGKKKRKPKPEPAPKEQAPPPAPEPEPPPPPPPEPEAPAGPWAEGVSDERKATAQGLLEAGNALFLDKKYGEALEQYRQAVGAWDHPAIRFNMVRCEIQLERPVEAYEDLVLALKYGAAPLEEAVYNEALAYEKLLLGQIAEIEVSCKQSGTVVTLDGQPLLTCPDIKQRRLVPGQHQVVGRKEGHLTQTQDVVLLPGKDQAIVVELETLSEAAVLTRRWPAWKPWAVVGGGVLLGGLGGLVQLSAISTMDDYNAAVAEECAGGGCQSEGPTMLSPRDADLETTALLYNKVAIGMMAAGAATVITGAVLVFMNRQRTTYPEEHAQVALTPLPGGGGAFSIRVSY